jgi:hypothetical protein
MNNTAVKSRLLDIAVDECQLEGMPIPSQAEVNPTYTDYINSLPEVVLAYIAGFVDGEGAFTVNRRWHKSKDKQSKWIGYSAYLEVGNTDQTVIDWLHDVLKITSDVFPQKQKPPRRICYRLRMSGKQSIVVATAILPYLIVKKDIARLFIRFPIQHKKLDRPEAIKVFEAIRQQNTDNGKGRARIKEAYSVCVETLQEAPHNEDEEKVHPPKKLEEL